jgi:prolyl oligopeptidase
VAVTISSPPTTPVEPIAEILHGVEVTDPYRWLEEQDSQRTRKWLDEQNAYTRLYFDAIPGRDQIRKRVEELLAVETISEPWKVGNRYFFLKRAPHQQQAVIMVRDGDSGEESVLVDPILRGEGPEVAIAIISIARDGKVLAYGIKHGGTDPQAVEFLDVAQKQILCDRLPLGRGPGLVFSADGRGFYYTHELVTPDPRFRRAVYWHAFGTNSSSDVEIFSPGEDPNLHVLVLGSSDASLLAYVVAAGSDPITFDVYLRGPNSQSPRKILDSFQSYFRPFFVGRTLLALTDWQAPNFRIVALDPQHPGPDHWRDVVPPSQLRIKDFAVAGNLISVGYVEKYSSRIEVFDLLGNRRPGIEHRRNCTARLVQRTQPTDTLFYSLSSFHEPPTIFSYDPVRHKQECWAKTTVPLADSAVEMKEIHYLSKDGTDIPMFLVARKERFQSGPLPTFLTGYGGFGTSLAPQFNAYSTFLVEHGFLFAVANLRGGAEFGEDWHLAAKRHKRQNAIDDFISAAESLLQNGYSAPNRIAVGGGSNAGLLVGTALTQRPDLFRAVVCVGPLLDMVRYHRFDAAIFYVNEYGTSEKESDFHHLLAYSPYHHVSEGVPYPAVLLVSGDADTRCNPMHSRKMTARLQAATKSGLPILLQYRPTWGHAPVQPLDSRVDALTDRLAFLFKEIGVSV